MKLFSVIKIIAVFIIVLALVFIWQYSYKDTLPHFLFWQTNFPTSEDLCQIYIFGEDNIWTTGCEGKLFRSLDSGDIWEEKDLPDSDDLAISDIFFNDNTAGWIIRGSGSILKTADGGKNWTEISPVIENRKVKTVWFLGDSELIIAGGAEDNEGKAFLNRSIDGGENWSDFTYEFPGFRKLFFIGDKKGLGVTEDGLVMTDDTGKSWRRTLMSNGLNTVFFRNNTFGWTGNSKNSFLLTSDGGETWKKVDFGNFNGLNSIFFNDPEEGWAVGNDGLVLYTSDGGKSWLRLETGVSENFKSIKFLHSDLGLICGDNGALIKVEAEKSIF